MGFELRPAAGMTGLEEAGRELDSACRGLGLGPEIAGWVTAAGIAAMSAALLAGAGEPLLTLDKGPARVALRLQYLPSPEAGDAPPPGLAPALFSPPALKVSWDREGERVAWTAVWEI